MEAIGLEKLEARLTRSGEVPCDWLEVQIWISLVLNWKRGKSYRSCQLLIKSWPFLAIATEIAWFPGLVTAGCRSEI